MICDVISDVLKNDNLNWSARQAALFALNQLMKCDIKNCEEFLTIQGQVTRIFSNYPLEQLFFNKGYLKNITFRIICYG